jgi:hypothetical protein
MPSNDPYHAEAFEAIEAGMLVRSGGGHFDQFRGVGVG